MPDLTIESGWMCASNEHWEKKVPASKGDEEYTVVFGRTYDPSSPWDFGWSCTCPAFTHRHKRRGEHCKHIKQVEKHRCGWNAEMEPGLSVKTNDKGENCCPNCGGEVVAFRAGV